MYPNSIFKHAYPYTDLHELNLDWIIKQTLEQNEHIREFVNENTITLADPIEWSKSNYYNKAVIVEGTDGNSYLSIREVPAGIEITNNEYWVKVANVNAQIASVNNKINTVCYVVNDTMSQAEIQEAINNYDYIKFKRGTYNVSISENYGYGYSIGSNKTLLLDDATIKLLPSTAAAYEILSIANASNVNIFGGTISGDKTVHTGTGGEWGDCINITNASNVSIYNTILNNGWGDGIEVYTGKNLLFDNLKVINNRRNGMSVISGGDIEIRSCYFNGNGGTNPQNGIDIETNSESDALGYINIHDCTFENTLSENSISINSHKTGVFDVNNIMCDKGIAYTELSNNCTLNVNINNCNLKGIYLSKVSSTCSVNISDCTVENYIGRIVLQIAYNSSAENVIITNLRVLNSNVSFLYTCGTVNNSLIEILLDNVTFTEKEGLFNNTPVKLISSNVKEVTSITKVDGSIGTYLLTNNSPQNALTYGEIPVGTSINVINLTAGYKIMGGYPSDISAYGNESFSSEGTFKPNSFYKLTGISYHTVLFEKYSKI